MAEVTKKIKGMEITLDPDILEDFDVMSNLMSIVPSENENPTPEESKRSMEALMNLTNTLYGKDFEKIKTRLRKANGGKLPVSLIGEFISETFEAFAKNS